MCFPAAPPARYPSQGQQSNGLSGPRLTAMVLGRMSGQNFQVSLPLFHMLFCSDCRLGITLVAGQVASFIYQDTNRFVVSGDGDSFS